MNNNLAKSLLLIFVLIGLSCFQLEAQQYTEWSKPVNMGSSINTEFSDFHNAISADGRSIFFASDRSDGLGDFDFWTAHRPNRNAAWGKAQNVGPVINTDFGEFGPELTVDGHWLFFCNNNTGHIYASVRNNTSDNVGWETPVDLGSGVNRSFLHVRLHRDTHPTLRRDGLEVIFSSDRPGSFGQIDLWTSTRATTHDKWSTPVNLGPQINTADMERAPYLSDDALTLILVSDRPGGFGGNDLYISTRKKIQ